MDRLLRLFVAGIVVVIVLIIGAKLMLRHELNSPPPTSASKPAPTQTAPASAAPEDPCAQSVILTLRSHSGVSAQMSLQNMDGQNETTQDASSDDGRFTTECQRLENDDPGGDSSQVVRLCKPGKFVVHITGSGKGVFDFQAKALPDVAHPISPLLLCNYALDNDRTYDWVLKYQGGSKPAVFLLGSKGDPNLQQ